MPPPHAVPEDNFWRISGTVFTSCRCHSCHPADSVSAL